MLLLKKKKKRSMHGILNKLFFLDHTGRATGLLSKGCICVEAEPIQGVVWWVHLDAMLHMSFFKMLKNLEPILLLGCVGTVTITL